MKLQVIDWVKSGAPLHEGIRLFILLRGENHPFLKLLQADHQSNYSILIRELCRSAGVNPEEVNRKSSFRDNWPFLADLNCPHELKILATDKISAYHSYTRAHAMLFECETQAEQLATVKTLVRSYMENRAIIAEFVHYREHGHVLGKHPIFKQLAELEQLRKLNPVELITLQGKLEHNIWRIESELASGTKPHLESERTARMRWKQLQLEEVTKLLHKYR
jgi:hypothetical protein